MINIHIENNITLERLSKIINLYYGDDLYAYINGIMKNYNHNQAF